MTNKVHQIVFKAVIYISILMFLSSCSIIKTVSLINSGQPERLYSDETVIHFTMKSHAILVKARINNSQNEYTFMLDTGALTVIDKKVADELSLKKEVEIDSKDSSNNTKKTNLVKLESLSIGDIKVQNCGAAIMDVSSKFGVDGIIGSNFMRYFQVTIDYLHYTVLFTDGMKHRIAGAGEQMIPINLDMKWGFAPVIKCIVDGDQVDAIIDTGAFGLALPVDFIEKTKEFSSKQVLEAEGTMSFGVVGPSKKDYLLRLNTFSIGDLNISNVPCGLTQTSMVLLGQRALRHFLITLDYPAGQMILKRYRDMKFETNSYSTGLGLRKDKGKTVVMGFYKGSPAAKSQIKIGDEVVKVNSHDTDTLSMLDLMEIFTDEIINVIEIEYLQNGNIQKVVLQKEMLLPILN